MTRPLLAAGALLALLLALPCPAADDVTEARTRFDQGSKLYRAGKYRDAIVQFEAAYRVKPHGAIHYNVAQCWEKLEQWPEALQGYQAYLREVADARDRAAVRATMGRIERRLAAAGVQALLVYTDPPGAAVRIDGKPRGRTPYHLTLAPGIYRVSISLDGYAPDEQEVEMNMAGTRLVDVVLQTRAAAGRVTAAGSAAPGAPAAAGSPTAISSPAASPAGSPTSSSTGTPASTTGPTGTVSPTGSASPTGTASPTGSPTRSPTSTRSSSRTPPGDPTSTAAGAYPLTVKQPDLSARPAAAAAEAATPVAPLDPAPSLPPPPRPRIYTWIAAGVAVAAGAAGVAYGLSSGRQAESLRDGSYHADAASIARAAEKKATTANVLYAVSGVAAAAGVTLFFVEGTF